MELHRHMGLLVNLWKFRAPKPDYNPNLPISTGPPWLIEVPHPPIHDPDEAARRAKQLKDRDGLAWEPTPL